MFYDSELNLLRKMLAKCHLNSEIIQPKDIFNPKNNSLYKTTNVQNKTFLDLFPNIKKQTVYRVTNVFLCEYIFFELPSYSERKVFIIGPFTTFDITHQQIQEQVEKIGIAVKHINELELYYASLPYIKEKNHIFAMVNSFAEFIWNGAFETADISLENSASIIPISLEQKPDSDPNLLNIQMMEQRYNYENELLIAVSQGDINKAEVMFSSFSSLAFETRTSDSLRNMKNYCIIMNTLFRKAAERGGVHPIHLNSVSSDFAKRIEGLGSFSSGMNFMSEILQTYCRLVKRHSVKNLSPLIQKVIIKIESDLSGPLSLGELAKTFNVSASYLSGLFKKETGETLTNYVNSKRIKHAKYLLKNTNSQIQTVAQHCGILDLHYFCRIFKKSTGKTPSAYRSDLTFD